MFHENERKEDKTVLKYQLFKDQGDGLWFISNFLWSVDNLPVD